MAVLARVSTGWTIPLEALTSPSPAATLESERMRESFVRARVAALPFAGEDMLPREAWLAWFYVSECKEFKVASVANSARNGSAEVRAGKHTALGR